MSLHTTRWTLGALLAIGALVACHSAGASSAKSDEESALRATDLAWSETANRKEVDACASYMADDGETLGPNAPAARGKAAIRAAWATLIGLPGFTVHWEPRRVQVADSGELGYTSGVYTLTVTGADGKTVTDRGKYVEVWKKIDGRWKCSSDAYSSDLPVP